MTQLAHGPLLRSTTRLGGCSWRGKSALICWPPQPSGPLLASRHRGPAARVPGLEPRRRLRFPTGPRQPHIYTRTRTTVSSQKIGTRKKKIKAPTLAKKNARNRKGDHLKQLKEVRRYSSPPQHPTIAAAAAYPFQSFLFRRHPRRRQLFHFLRFAGTTLGRRGRGIQRSHGRLALLLREVVVGQFLFEGIHL